MAFAIIRLEMRPCWFGESERLAGLLSQIGRRCRRGLGQRVEKDIEERYSTYPRPRSRKMKMKMTKAEKRPKSQM